MCKVEGPSYLLFFLKCSGKFSEYLVNNGIGLSDKEQYRVDIYWKITDIFFILT
jgi:hypothetical protein